MDEEQIFRDFKERIRHYDSELKNPDLADVRRAMGLEYISPNVVRSDVFLDSCFYDGFSLDTILLGREESYFSCPECGLVYILPVKLSNLELSPQEVVEEFLKGFKFT